MYKPVLLCCVHDPKGDNIMPLTKVINRLDEVYSQKYITVSDVTCQKLIDKLRKYNFKIRTIPKRGAANARREVLSFGLDSNGDYFHYCDFDRIITWASRHFDELKRVAEELKCSSYIIFGRTERAFSSHPIEWQETEKISNSICSIVLKKEVDVTAGSCGFSRECLEGLIQYSNAKMTDSEWPMIVKRIIGLEIDYKKVDGLEYIEDINALRREQTDNEKWIGRLKLCQIICEAVLKIDRENKER